MDPLVERSDDPSNDLNTSPTHEQLDNPYSPDI